MDNQPAFPLVSVIIPCYNHGHFLAEAIDSVLAQTWSPIEIIVVDDGSTDTTRSVADTYPSVHYVYQTNQGLSAARNTGIGHSSGDFLVFLDADDWLFTDGIAFNVQQLQQYPEAAFVSGAHDKLDATKKILSDERTTIAQDHYRHLLEGNYIGMHATVLYRRSLFADFLFDTTLKACEDYDLYLKIARCCPVVHHTHKIAAYRIHGSNMSADIPMMLNRVLYVLSRQRKGLRSPLEIRSYRRGRQNWRDYYTMEIYKLLDANRYSGNAAARKEAFILLLRNKPTLYSRYWKTKLWNLLKRS